MSENKIVSIVTPDKALVPSGSSAIAEKLADAMTPGYVAEFDPEEAEQAGAFVEDALSAEDAIESAVDAADEE